MEVGLKGNRNYLKYEIIFHLKVMEKISAPLLNENEYIHLTGAPIIIIFWNIKRENNS